MLKTIITAALPYSYSMPHLGNFVGSVLPADVYYKYLKMRGDDVIYICGSDQHGTAIELKALKDGISAQELSDNMHNAIKDAFESMECTFTRYGKTHSEENQQTVYEMFDALDRNGYITETVSRQAYCNVDKMYLLDRMIEGKCPVCGGEHARGDQCDDCGHLIDPTQIINPHCTICGKTDIKFEDVKNLALALDKLQGEVKKFIEGTASDEWTKNAVNKPLSYIKEGLKARDITRSIKWGFPVKKEGYENLKFYVWFDALLGYISISKEWNRKRYEEFWLPKTEDERRNIRLVQFMGKDNIEFHTLVWPGILIGSGKGFTLPTAIRASEFLNAKGFKFSKSRGIGLNVQSALSVLEADYWRFALMQLYPETADSEFSLEALEEAVNKLMNDKIGNLLHRVLTIAKNNRSLLEGAHAISDAYKNKSKDIIERYSASFDKMALREALRALVDLADYGNEIMSAEEPWTLAKKAGEDSSAARRFKEVIDSLLNITYYVSVLLWPFAPKASRKALSYFGIDADPSMGLLESEAKPNLDAEITPIFSKIDAKKMDELRKVAGA